ncbi:conserved hypothetical protein [Ricinus communis]|uniref:Uncharacterized protein n=1 Tax=Ricinus communis TaxID=3988 RepID=B9TJP0_RICCO|nr:conserved hypothetical protein [Ricinus communis]
MPDTHDTVRCSKGRCIVRLMIQRPCLPENQGNSGNGGNALPHKDFAVPYRGIAQGTAGTNRSADSYAFLFPLFPMHSEAGNAESLIWRCVPCVPFVPFEK